MGRTHGRFPFTVLIATLSAAFRWSGAAAQSSIVDHYPAAEWGRSRQKPQDGWQKS